MPAGLSSAPAVSPTHNFTSAFRSNRTAFSTPRIPPLPAGLWPGNLVCTYLIPVQREAWPLPAATFSIPRIRSLHRDRRPVIDLAGVRAKLSEEERDIPQAGLCEPRTRRGHLPKAGAAPAWVAGSSSLGKICHTTEEPGKAGAVTTLPQTSGRASALAEKFDLGPGLGQRSVA